MISAPEFLAYGQPPPVDYPISDLGPDQSAAQVSEVIEIGSGSGAGVLSLLEQLPGAHVVCLEPDDVARAGLAWRLHDHPERDRVSILPLRLQDALALGPVDLVVAHHVICQVQVADRPRFWRDVARLLRPGGIALFDSHLGRSVTAPVQRRQTLEVANGDYRIARWFTAEQVGDAMRTTNEYVITGPDGRVVDHQSKTEDFEIVDEDLARQQIATMGFEAVDINDRWLGLTLTR